MDSKTIAQIMSVVNGDHDDGDHDMSMLTKDLRQRLPINQSHVKSPSDPVSSVSSFDDSPVETKHQQHIEPKHESAPKHNIENNVEPKHDIEPEHITTKQNDLLKTITLKRTSNDIVNKSSTLTVPSHMTSLMGYLIPTSTLYFIIVLLIIAVAIYFLTSEKKKPIESEQSEDEKKKDK